MLIPERYRWAYDEGREHARILYRQAHDEP